MSKKFVYICSPLRGDYKKNTEKAREYCAQAMTNFPDVIPIAPHIYFPQFLDDKDPEERALGIEAGLKLLDMCEELWVCGLKNPSELPSAGMQREIDYAQRHNIPVLFVVQISGKDEGLGT